MVKVDCFLAMKKKKELNHIGFQKKQNLFKPNYLSNNRNQS